MTLTLHSHPLASFCWKALIALYEKDLAFDPVLVDCAAAPALFYADLVAPLAEAAPTASAYLDRLMARPSIARTMREAEPNSSLYPRDPKPSLTRG